MPDIEITVGGRNFNVACQPGEEEFLRTAAAHLDGEANGLLEQAGRLPETRMLLMAGLMLGDRLAGLEEKMRLLEEKVETREKMIADLRAANEAGPERVEVPVVPQELGETLAEIAARAEALAEDVSERATARSS